MSSIKEKIKVLLVVPAYNEALNIEKVVKDINEYKTKCKYNLDYIIINDGSLDNTEEILKKNKANHIELIKNLGIGGAVQTGYRYALEKGYDIAVQYDGDNQHNIEYIENLCEPIINGKANMVIGSRFVDKEKEGFKSSFLRRFGIKIISSLIKFVTKTKIYDCTSGYRAIDKKLIEKFAENYPIEYPEPISSVECLVNDFKIKEVPVIMNERVAGKSSIYSWKNVYYMYNVIVSVILIGIGGRK